MKKYDKKIIIDEKFEALQNEIKDLDDKYEKDMSVFRTREKYLKASVNIKLCRFPPFNVCSKIYS